jgi:uracil-DNA glycosylase
MSKLYDKIDASWKELFLSQSKEDYFKDLTKQIAKSYNSGTVYPPKNKVFNALNLSALTKTKVLILGQDPYHGEGQANGLAFSVNSDIKIPPSLRNIYKELESDLGIRRKSGDLTDWASQGVLLLNTVLTVEKGKANSHKSLGWEKFTDAIIKHVSNCNHECVFILWGSPAHKKIKLIDESKHLVLKSVHPSPLSSYRGFFGSKPFSKTNEYLKKHNKKMIKW